MKRAIVFAATLIVSLVVVPPCMAQGSAPAVGEEDAHAIGVAAYLYFYPLVTMDLTRKQLTNVEPGKLPGHGPMNALRELSRISARERQGRRPRRARLLVNHTLRQRRVSSGEQSQPVRRE